MGRRRKSKREWILSPHADGPPQNLWWYRALLSEERLRVLTVYFERLTYIRSKRDELELPLTERWDQVCCDFEGRQPGNPGSPTTIEEIIQRVTVPDSKSRSIKERGRFMTLEGAALERKLKPTKVYRWFRRLDSIARELYPVQYDACPDTNPPVSITEEMKRDIRAEYLENGNARELAGRYGLPAFRIGQIVAAEKKLRRERFAAERAAEAASYKPNPTIDDLDEF